MNKAPFYIGEEVIYTGRNCLEFLKLKTNDIVKVKNLRTLSCGCWIIDIGEKLDDEGTMDCLYHICNKVSNEGIIWFYPTCIKSLYEKTFLKISK